MKAAFSAEDFERAIVNILRKYDKDFSDPLEVRLLDSDLEGRAHGKA